MVKLFRQTVPAGVDSYYGWRDYPQLVKQTAQIGTGLTRIFVIYLIRFCSHNEVVLMQPADGMRPILKIQVASIPKFLVCRLPIK